MKARSSDPHWSDAAAISIGWLIAYESRRGRNEGIYDRDDDGAQR
ncbi:hypothetical protein [Microbacterium marinum]